jgi:hypothetical protein
MVEPPCDVMKSACLGLPSALTAAFGFIDYYAIAGANSCYKNNGFLWSTPLADR